MPFWGQERDKKLFSHAHESPRVMTVPLIILAIGAALAGYLGVPRLSLIEHWLEPVFAGRTADSASELRTPALAHRVGAAGAVGAGRARRRVPGLPGLRRGHRRCRSACAQSLGWFATLVENKYYVDEAYNKVVVEPLRALSGWFAGAVRPARHRRRGQRRWPASTGWVGTQARRLQTGMVGLYALVDPVRRGGAAGVAGDR